MYKIIILFVISGTLFINNSTYAQQLKNFSTDNNSFLGEMKDLLETKDKKEGKELMEKFTLVWNGSYYGNDEKKKIIETANELLKKRALAFPHFQEYLLSLIAFSNANHAKSSYQNWEKGLVYMCQKKNVTLNAIDTYLDNSEGLVRKGNVFKSTTTRWNVSTKDFKFIFDGEDVKVIFGQTDLSCYAKRDSSSIYSTQGIYFPFTKTWKGQGGKVTWERAGFKSTDVFANLQNYKIDITKSSLEADSVIFVNTRYFKEPLLGHLSEKVMADVDTTNANYPQFKSYSKRYKIDNIYPGMNYDGGFTMKGAKFIGEGTDNDLALIKIYRKDTLFFVGASRTYVFRDEGIIGQNTAVTFYLDTDSIFHPGLLFKYNQKQNEISLVRNDEGMSRSPYFDTYHNLELDFPYLTWKLGDPKIDFKPITKTTNKTATFESVDFFSRDRFLELQGMDIVNPLQNLKNFSKKVNSKNFTDKEFADFIKASIPQTKQYLLNLAFKGFIAYFIETGQVIVMDKTFNYLKCSVGQRDYDAISFVSNVVENDNNATLSLLDFNLKMKGVEEIFLSDSQNVAIFPNNQEITIKRNRDFVFDGRVRAGLFLFIGSNFSFSYNKFKLNLTDIRTIKMRVVTNETDQLGMPVQKDLISVIENSTGELLIDDQMNKSGVKDFPQYPIFNSKKDSYVFYDAPSIQSGVYKRDNFYFQIFPYSIDSIGILTKKNLLFKGHFISAGIFPPFNETISVQPDYSLGFKRNTPEEGFQAYGGKGTYKKEIFLSNMGLRGDGELKFLTAKALSNNFLFFPDSMNTTAKTFEIEKQTKGVEFASVKGENIYVHWVPNADRMFITNTNKPFEMYDKQATFTGTLQIEPKGLSGWGMLEFSTAQLTSKMFDFKEHIVDADTANFNLKTVDMNEFSFKTNNVNSHIDFQERKGEFQSNGDASFVEFPQNQYKCYMDQFTWFMDKEEIEMSASNKALSNVPANKTNLSPTELEDVQLKGSQFISTHPNQDSLTFVAPSAKYNLRKYIISANEVKFIRVADATIYPGDGKVVIEKNAVMQTLKDSRIIANNTNRYHTIYNATSNIYGRKNYSSSGSYDYVDETKNKQVIKFDVVSVDSTYQTYANGKIGITDGFTLSPNFGFTGSVKLNANDQFLLFEGSTKISHECINLDRYWVNFKSKINPNEIYIPIGDSLKEINNNKVHAGFYITNDSTHIYPAFLTKHKNYSDIPVFSSRGFLTFDKADSKYKISNKEKLVEFNLPGDYLSLHRSACNMYGEGKLNLGVDLGQIQLISVGNINEDLIKSYISMELLLGVDFFIEGKCMEIMTKDINGFSGLEPVDLSRSVFEKGLAEILGRDKANELISEYSLGKFKKMPKELEHTLMLTDLKLNWNTSTRSYIADTLIGIGSIGKEYVNKIVPGYMEIIKKRSGDIFTLYLELTDNVWYYFSYARGVMQVVSSNEEFNTVIKTLKPDQRKLNTDKGQKPYSYYPAAPTVKNKFLKRMRALQDKEAVVEPVDDENSDDKKNTE
jgi:hypothetical protein